MSHIETRNAPPNLGRQDRFKVPRVKLDPLHRAAMPLQLRQAAAVNGQACARDKFGFVARQENRCSRDIIGRTNIERRQIFDS
jgi:hypothetical protein